MYNDFNEREFYAMDAASDRAHELDYQNECDNDEFLAFERRYGADPEAEAGGESAIEMDRRTPTAAPMINLGRKVA